MHPNQAYRKAGTLENLEFARKRGFGILAVNSQDGPLLSHIPFHLSADGKLLEAHLVRSNPIVRLLDEARPAVVAISGGDGYVSPDWYGMQDQVPTWNYVAIHLRGTIVRLPDQLLPGILDRLSAEFETRIPGKKPWTAGKMDASVRQRMMRQVLPVAMQIEAVEGTWKLSQNKPDAAISGAAAGLESCPIGQECRDLAGLMRQVAGKAAGKVAGKAAGKAD